jgi:hypothetical protein
LGLRNTLHTEGISRRSHCGPIVVKSEVTFSRIVGEDRDFGKLEKAGLSCKGFGLSPFGASCYNASMDLRHRFTLARRAPRFAAAVAATAFIVVAGCEMFWALGGSRGLSGAWGGNRDHLPVGLRVASAFAAFLLGAGAIIVLGRARYWVSSDRLGILRWGTWALVAVMGLSAIANFASSSDMERFQNGPAALLLALLCLVVARSQ